MNFGRDLRHSSAPARHELNQRVRLVPNSSTIFVVEHHGVTRAARRGWARTVHVHTGFKFGFLGLKRHFLAVSKFCHVSAVGALMVRSTSGALA